MRLATRSLLVLTVLTALTASPARAQQTTGALFALLPELVGTTLILKDTGHQAHFTPGPEALDVPNEFNRELVTLLSTFPLGSSSGGFTFSFDEGVGAVARRSSSFGPSFAERSVTAGRGKVSVGAYFQHLSYKRFEGQRLDDGSIKFYIQHQDVEHNGLTTPYREGDIIEASMSLGVETETTAVLANVGVTDNLDVGVAVPLVRVRLAASLSATLERLATAGTVDENVHLFTGGDPDRDVFTRSGEATGLGDVVLRAKYNFSPTRTGGVAAGVDLRVPTGAENQLLGAGAVQAKLYSIFSGQTGAFAPHVNFGYTFSKSGALVEVSDELNYALGTEFTPSNRYTLAIDLVGRRLQSARRLALADREFAFTAGDSAPIERVTRQEFRLEPGAGSVNMAMATIGVKVNVARTALVTANVLVPLTHTGLRFGVTPVIGLDWSVK